MAPEAELIFQAVEQTPKWTKEAERRLIMKRGKPPAASDLLGIPSDLKDLFQDAYDGNEKGEGARIHSNSWGGGFFSTYNLRCRDLDEFVWKNKDFLVVVAAGNHGDKHHTITPPGTAKNCITVGACENDRPNEFPDTYSKWCPQFREKPLKCDSMVDSIDDIAAFSSRGPCYDGRCKPDVVAPGTFILSTRSSQIQHHSYAPFPPVFGQYMYMSGTSMATPLVAGSAALVRQYLRTREKERIENPSAALLKASLIHSAEYIEYCYAHETSQKWADNEQGWGRINLSQIINIDTPYDVKFVDQSSGLSYTGHEHEYQFTVTDNSTPLRVTLVYTDFPGEEDDPDNSTSIFASKLVNNLNLFVCNPENKRFCGNDFEQTNKPDDKNNVEGYIVNEPETGKWKIKIKASYIKKGLSQDYALVISGKITDWQQI